MYAKKRIKMPAEYTVLKYLVYG